MTYSTPARLYQLRSKITISPAAGKCVHVALHVQLRLLAVGRRGQRDDAEHAGADALGDGADGAALAGGIAALEDHDDAEALVLDPLLELAELGLEPPEFLLVHLAL